MEANSRRDINTLVEMSVFKINPYLSTERPLLWLCEKGVENPRLLPIAIGEFEAAAIQIKLACEEPLRPICYDLFITMVGCLNPKLRYVVIHEVHNSTFFASVTIDVNGGVRELDARPSDAIAMALRSKVPLYANGQVLDIAGYASGGSLEESIERFCEFEPQVLNEGTTDPSVHGLHIPSNNEFADPIDRYMCSTREQSDKLTELRNRLEIAVICEEYETAAELLGQISFLSEKEE